AVRRQLNWTTVREACEETILLSCLIFWIIIGASALSTFYTAMGATRLIESMILGLEVNRYIILAGMQLILLLLGMVLDTVGIIMITVPVFVPIALKLGFDPVWFGILFIINMEIGFLTPPFGYNLFYLKGVVPPNISLGDIYKSVTPFILLMIVAIGICIAFPEIGRVQPKALCQISPLGGLQGSRERVGCSLEAVNVARHGVLQQSATGTCHAHAEQHARVRQMDRHRVGHDVFVDLAGANRVAAFPRLFQFGEKHGNIGVRIWCKPRQWLANVTHHLFFRLKSNNCFRRSGGVNRQVGPRIDMQTITLVRRRACDSAHIGAPQTYNVAGLFQATGRGVAGHLRIANEAVGFKPEVKHAPNARAYAELLLSPIFGDKRAGIEQDTRQPVNGRFGQIRNLSDIRQRQPVVRRRHDLDDAQIAFKRAFALVVLQIFFRHLSFRPTT